MKLLVDIGNSRTKWIACTRAGNRAAVESFSTERLRGHSTAGLFADLSRPDQVMVSNVGGETTAAAMNRLCEDRWGLAAEYAVVDREAHGVRCAYADVQQLGVDRWLSIIAAWQVYKEACFIIDCGTATTMDIIDAEGQHQGGLIIPGLQMMQESLVQGTHQLDSTAAAGERTPAGNTAAAIANGCMQAVTSCIEQTLQTLRSTISGEIHCVATGGAAPAVQACLRCEFEYRETLVLEGLQLKAFAA
ncbi:MAG: type III pantothenate kinase [Thiotrichales bacterium]|nr:type III pantothenate kinase [Thiotrichales bacterium]